MKRVRVWLTGFVFLFSVIVGVLIWSLVPDEFSFLSKGSRIGVIEVRGVIADVQDTVTNIKKFRKDKNIKAILLRIESPGGGVGPSQEIYREVRRTIESKPVVASLGGIAASGGYYIASAASHVVANPGTVTGSIGVIVPFPNFRELFEKIGYGKTIVKSGQYKDLGDPGREMTPEEKALLQETVDAVHQQFIRDVASGRNLTEAKVREIADGRILTGEMALQLELVDELGNFEDGVKAAADLANLKEEPILEYAKKKRSSLLDFLLGEDLGGRINSYLEEPLYSLRYQLPSFP